MTHASERPSVLRLVHESRGADASPLRRITAQSGVRAAAPDPARRVSQAHVGAENRSASTLSPDDARLITARMAARSIEGGRAAIIRPEVRRRLVASAVNMGLRPFDANLVIAIVQDDARSGGVSTRPSPSSVSRDAADRLALVRPVKAPVRPGIPIRVAVLAGTLGLAVAAAIARWILAG